MNALTAALRRAAAEQTLELPFRVPAKEWFSLREAGAIIGLAESTVEKLYDKGELTGHHHNAGTGQRYQKRVLRVTLIAYMLRTADYSDESLTDSLVACLPHLPAPALLRIAAAATRYAGTKPLTQPAPHPRSA